MTDTTPSDQPMPPGSFTLIPAATLIVTRKAAAGGPPELLMAQRADTMRFAAGAAVFPGGRVDPADRELARSILPGEPEEIAAARIAAIRETLEETGLAVATRTPVSAQEAIDARRHLLEHKTLAAVLDRFAWVLEPQALTFYAHWCPLFDKAFDTRFFVTDLGTGAVELTADATETARLLWVSAADALAMADAERLSVIFPTRRNLERLAQAQDFAAIVDDARAHPVRRIHTHIAMRDGEEWLLVPEGHGYPIEGEPRAQAVRG